MFGRISGEMMAILWIFYQVSRETFGMRDIDKHNAPVAESEMARSNFAVNSDTEILIIACWKSKSDYSGTMRRNQELLPSVAESSNLRP